VLQDRRHRLRGLGHPAVVEIVEARRLGTEPLPDLERHLFPIGRVWRQQNQPLRRVGALTSFHQSAATFGTAER
jgi:hypothetical protein